MDLFKFLLLVGLLFVFVVFTKTSSIVDDFGRASVIVVSDRNRDNPLATSMIHGPTEERKKCSSDDEDTCYGSLGSHRVNITRDFSCTRKTIVSKNPSSVGPEVAVSTSVNISGYLYGGPEQVNQYWPLNNFTFQNYSYVTKQQDNQGIAERYWLTSNGIFYYIQPESSLFISQYNTTLEFITSNTAPYQSPAVLNHSYAICELENAKEAHMFAVEHFLHKPSDIPDELMVRNPIWSTWARYKRNINQEIVFNFTKEIIENGFNNSQIEIDDMWESCYGSLTFDNQKFPDMANFSKELKEKGYRITLWIHPFINVNCSPYYEEGLNKGFFVINSNNETITNWWNGEASIIDFTNPEAVAWWTERLEILRNESGIDSFKFDAGETSWLPQVPILTGALNLQPNLYTQKYVEAAARFGKMVEVRVGFQTQQYPLFVRMLDKDSRWDFQNGLRTLVTTLLQMNMVGYPFVLPDMVGGNGYDGAPSKELFIRWLQANVFMPAIQYSYVPWDYDNETVEICMKYTLLHAEYADRIIDAMKDASKYGTPVNPPIWWITPDDETAQSINDEFLLGTDILVAPILEENATSRNIYLPKGTWEDKLLNTIITGPTWLWNYSANLSQLPYFERQLLTSKASSDSNVAPALFFVCLVIAYLM